MKMALVNFIDNEYPNRNMENDFKIPTKLDKPDTWEHITGANEFNELEIGIIKKQKIELVKQEMLLNIQEENAIKKEDEAEETENSRQHITSTNEFNELEIGIIKKEKPELVEQEMLLNIQEEIAIKKEDEAEETGNSREHITSANEFNELEIGIIKKEKPELVEQEMLLNIQDEIAIKKEEDAEETTKNSIENQNDPLQDMGRNLELYASHEIKNELVIGPVVLQPQTISGVLKYEDTTEDFLEDSTIKLNPLTYDVGNKYLTIIKQENSFLDRCVPKTQSYSCGICDKTYENIKLLKKHVKIHKNGTINKYLLDRQHYQTNKDVYTCNICEKHYNNPVTISNHYKSYHPRQIIKYSCRVCHMKFGDVSYLITHNSVKHQTEFICDICGKSMNRKIYLNRHMSRHATMELFTCYVCGKHFNRKVNLQYHEKTHKFDHISSNYDNAHE